MNLKNFPCKKDCLLICKVAIKGIHWLEAVFLGRRTKNRHMFLRQLKNLLIKSDI